MPHSTRRAIARKLSPFTLVAILLALPGLADEGMWLFNEFPSDSFQAEYGFAPNQGWLDEVQAAAVRFNNGGSGSFVSPEGLVITNHHVGFDCIQKVSSAENDYISHGFTAAGRGDELPCPDLELNVLQSIERVTAKVKGAVENGMDASAAGEARRGAIADIEKECTDATGLRCNVVKLYAGGEYDLYRYRRHTDVRLAWAPELQFANFGGDPDNFEYPRFNLDAALFRVYEDGESHAPEAYLPVDAGGAEQGEVAFLAGNPGSTGRLSTVAELTFLRDYLYPDLLNRLAHRRDVLLAYSARGGEQERIAKDALLGVENGLKAVSGYMSGLLDDELMEKKAAQEARIRKAVAADAALAERIGDPWSEIDSAQRLYTTLYPRAQALGGADGGSLASTALQIVRLADQRQKPDADRLSPYREPALPSLFQQLYSEAPIYPDYEELLLTQGLSHLLYQLGPTHPLSVDIFGDESPAQVARRAVTGTRLGDVEARRKLVEADAEALAASEDPMIRLMRKIEPMALEITERIRDEVDSIETDAGSRIADAFFAVEGRETYPDATFSLRLSYGRVTGYRQGGQDIPWHTDFKGLVSRSKKYGGEAPFTVPAGLTEHLEEFDLATPLNFVSTHDIIGGNSGSPVIDRDGNFIGIVFDGNLEMLPNRFVYQQETSRAISVDARAILEVLTKVYDADHLAEELLGGAIAARGANLDSSPVDSESAMTAGE